MGALSFWYIWSIGIRKKWKIFIFKKRKIFRGGSNWNIFNLTFLGGANFKFNFLSHFLINFKNSCAYLGANFLNFMKHPQLFKFWCFWMKLWKKQGKSTIQKMDQFEPPMKIFLFLRWNFATFFLFLWIKSTKMKVRPYFAMQKVQKLLKTP